MRLTIALTYLLVGAVFAATPNLTRRRLFFSVPVTAEFRRSELGRHLLLVFRAVVGAASLGLFFAILLCPASAINVAAVAGPTLLIAITGLAFGWQKRRVLPFADQLAPAHEADLSTSPETLPWFTPLGAGPLLLIGICAAFLHQHWQSIPLRFAVHWSADGTPNRWVERSVHGVYGPLLFGAELCSWILFAALAGWFGARRSRLRRPVFGFMIATEYLLGFLFSAIAINPLIHIPMWIFVLSPMLFMIAMLLVMARKASECNEAAEVTPNDCWYAGLFYFNPADAALMVEKREGLAYTFNFGNRWSWLLALGLVIVMSSAFFVL